MSRVQPEDLTDAELAALDAILSLADGQLSPRPIMRIELDTTDLGYPKMNGMFDGTGPSEDDARKTWSLHSLKRNQVGTSRLGNARR